MREHVIVSYGGGTNSTAMLVGLYEMGERPDAIVFADTGGEKPGTYRHIREVDQWLQNISWPGVTVLQGAQWWGPRMVADGSLEAECIRLGKMPAKAYGFGTCSLKWKIEPQRRFDTWYAAQHGVEVRDITRLIGFDADEPSRVDRALANAASTPNQQRFPLVEWDWGRDECVAAIARAGLPQPGKSACFFCPSSKKHEILWLRDNEPQLLARALEMERRARAGEGQAEASRGGLGRSVIWADFIAASVQGTCPLSDAGIPEEDCGCYDG
jgi:hypothetical protein